MDREVLKSLIDMIDDEDTETVFKVLIRFIPENQPLPDEVQAIRRANQSIREYGTVLHEEINWE